MRVVFMGTPDFAVPSLGSLILDGYQVLAVYTQPDQPAGRGRSLVYSVVKRAALDFKLPVLQPSNFKETGVLEQLTDFHPDVIVVAAFGQLLPESVLKLPRYGCINIHPSLLPRFRGPSPVAAAILADDDFTGVTIMLMDKGLDTGPVLAKAQVPILDADNTASLTSKLSRIGAQLLLDILPRWVGGEIKPQPQDETWATYSNPLTKEDGEIDWSRPAIELWRRLRAFYPWPGCYTKWQGKQLKIVEAVPLPEADNETVGQVVPLDKGGAAAFGINTGEGIIGILTVQLEGKRVMPAAEFLRGARQLIGAILPSD
ncbi:MAG: methionyl-tRNA formyltransferase [Chloroflexota bacterium]